MLGRGFSQFPAPTEQLLRPSAPLRKSTGLVGHHHPNRPGRDQSPARLQRLNDSRDHVCVRAAANPDRDAVDLNLDRPDVGPGLSIICFFRSRLR